MTIAELLSRIAAHDFLKGCEWIVCPNCERILEGNDQRKCPRCGSYRKVKVIAL